MEGFILLEGVRNEIMLRIISKYLKMFG